jgi:hypothetical protein
MEAGPALDDMLGRSVLFPGLDVPAPGVSTSWDGARQLVERLTALGCYLEAQVHADRCLCRVLRVLSGNVVAKQLASVEAATLPEAVAKAALLACLEMQPQPD